MFRFRSGIGRSYSASGTSRPNNSSVRLRASARAWERCGLRAIDNLFFSVTTHFAQARRRAYIQDALTLLMDSREARQPHRKFHRPHQADARSDTLAGDVKSRSMVDRRADDRQAQRHIHAALEVQQLQWDVALVVVHAYDGVVLLALHSQIENRIGRQRPFHRHSLRNRPLDGRPDLANLLIAE